MRIVFTLNDGKPLANHDAAQFDLDSHAGRAELIAAVHAALQLERENLDARRAERLAAKESLAADLHRNRGLYLLEHGRREEIIEWLCKNDRNGMYSDADSLADDKPILSYHAARALLREILNRK